MGNCASGFCLVSAAYIARNRKRLNADGLGLANALRLDWQMPVKVTVRFNLYPSPLQVPVGRSMKHLFAILGDVFYSSSYCVLMYLDTSLSVNL